MPYVPPVYPGTIPSEANLFPWVDDEHYVSTAKFEAIVKELRAALVELGTDPAGNSDTVKLRLEQIEGSLIPTGTIAMWSGTLANIPTGWALCDGAGGRPNLLDRFIKGVPDDQTDPGDVGGASPHIHTGPNHNHPVIGETADKTYNACSDEGGACSHAAMTTHKHAKGTLATSNAGTGNTGGADPKYYKLAYIIKT